MSLGLLVIVVILGGGKVCVAKYSGVQWMSQSIVGGNGVNNHNSGRFESAVLSTSDLYSQTITFLRHTKTPI